MSRLPPTRVLRGRRRSSGGVEQRQLAVLLRSPSQRHALVCAIARWVVEDAANQQAFSSLRLAANEGPDER